MSSAVSGCTCTDLPPAVLMRPTSLVSLVRESVPSKPWQRATASSSTSCDMTPPMTHAVSKQKKLDWMVSSAPTPVVPAHPQSGASTNEAKNALRLTFITYSSPLFAHRA